MRKRRVRRARHVILLGPQRDKPTVGRVVSDLDLEGPVATVTAGWQERETEDDELNAALGVPAVNLRLFERGEEAIQDDGELATAHDELRERLLLIRRAYNVRLARLIEAWSALVRMKGASEILDPERDATLAMIRTLDREHVRRVRGIRERMADKVRLAERPSIRRHADEIAGIVRDSEAVVLAGGHVAVLLNRLNLFGVGGTLASKTIIAWSAGAMALCPQIVLFHDSPPQGPGNPEAFEAGLDLYPGLVPLPHARKRLRLDDPERTRRFATRFGPARCALLDPGTRLEWRRRGWRAVGEAWQLGPEGGLEAIRE